MSLPQRPVWLRRMEFVVFLCLLPYLLLHTLPRAWGSLNTDFPNYYLASRLVHEHQDVSRVFEWKWLQREKDTRDINRQAIGLVPITPVSTLAVYPLTSLSPLAAKHVWIVFNILLLFGIACAFRRLAGVTLLESGLLYVITFPLYKNLLFGQYYVLLLAVLVVGYWATARKRPVLAGCMVATGIALKIFPAVLLFFFLRKRSWKSIVATIVSGAGFAALSIAAFGWNANLTYVRQIVPRTLHGEGLPPFLLMSSSLSTALHRLFLYEPEWNPHPWMHSPLLFAVFYPLIQVVILLPAILMVSRAEENTERSGLEWSLLLTASLALSPIPASYNFCVLLLPMALLWGRLVRQERYGALAAYLLVYLGVCYPNWNTHDADGLRVLLHVSRLWCVVGLFLVLYRELRQSVSANVYAPWWNTNRAWTTAALAAMAFSIAGGLAHERHMEDDFAFRIPSPAGSSLLSQPQELQDGSIRYLTMSSDGYALAETRGNQAAVLSGQRDILSFATDRVSGALAYERDVPGEGSPVIVQNQQTVIADASSPALLPRNAGIAFLRNVQGRYHLFVRHTGTASDRLLSPPDWNVLEISASQGSDVVFSAELGGEKPALFSVPSKGGPPKLLRAATARYPSISPDGQWLAYSELAAGSWNLRLRNLETGEDRPVDHVPCNQMEPSWEHDGKTLLYASDCGRALWFTVICRRRVLP